LRLVAALTQIKGDPMSPKRKLSLIFFVAIGLFFSVVPEILAVVGRPLTPVSYAGVARRTVRRSGYYY
jgi:hypothetical protein